eukprot:8617203-Pyramimonas_sp.AAC.1
MFQLGLARDVPADSPCVVCSLHAGAYTCPICGLAWHDECSAGVALGAAAHSALSAIKSGLAGDAAAGNEVGAPAARVIWRAGALEDSRLTALALLAVGYDIERCSLGRAH